MCLGQPAEASFFLIYIRRGATASCRQPPERSEATRRWRLPPGAQPDVRLDTRWGLLHRAICCMAWGLPTEPVYNQPFTPLVGCLGWAPPLPWANCAEGKLIRPRGRLQRPDRFLQLSLPLP